MLEIELQRTPMHFNLRFAVAAELVELDKEGYKELEELMDTAPDYNRDDGLETIRPPYNGLGAGNFSVVALTREGWMEQNMADFAYKSVDRILSGQTWTIYVTPAGITYQNVPKEQQITVVGREFLYSDGIMTVVDDKTPLQSLVKALTLCNAYKLELKRKSGCIIA